MAVVVRPLKSAGGRTYVEEKALGDPHIQADEVDADFDTIYAAVNALPAGPPGPQGPAGPTGPPGPAGTDGATGPQGPAGLKGDPGATGAQGPAGAKGDPGSTGPAGADGAQGVKGDPGPTGPTGADGTTGATGPAGAKGDPGPQGATGLQGPKGDSGATGPPGNTGPQGLQGIPGPTGPAGADGAPGATGATGAQGLKGDTGATGPPGADSTVPGPQGLKGDAGATGAQGPQGLQGPTGPGVPIGGSTGQQLQKTSATDFATAWVTPPTSLPPSGAATGSLAGSYPAPTIAVGAVRGTPSSGGGGREIAKASIWGGDDLINSSVPVGKLAAGATKRGLVTAAVPTGFAATVGAFTMLVTLPALTTVGGVVLIMGTAGLHYEGSNTENQVIFGLYRDGALTSQSAMTRYAAVTAGAYKAPIGQGFSYIDAPSAGAHTYAIAVYVVNAQGTVRGPTAGEGNAGFVTALELA